MADEAEGEIERSGTHISTLIILHELFLRRGRSITPALPPAMMTFGMVSSSTAD
jgi:hypothetical protein